jgi:hypothetical protein
MASGTCCCCCCFLHFPFCAQFLSLHVVHGQCHPAAAFVFLEVTQQLKLAALLAKPASAVTTKLTRSRAM